MRENRQNPGIAEAIKKAGNSYKLADILGVSQPAIFYWLHRSCPPERALQIEQELGIPKEKSCPEIFS